MELDQPVEEQDWIVQFETTAGYINSFIDGVSAIRPEGQLIADDGAVYTDIKDATNVALTISRIKDSGFNSYEFRGEDEFKIGINFEQFDEYMTSVSKNSNVVCTYPIESGGPFYMHIDVLEEDLEMFLPLIDKDSVPQSADTDPISSDTRIKIDGSDFKEGVKHCMKVKSKQNNALTFRTDGNKFILESSDQTKGSISKTFASSGPSDSNNLGQKETIIGMDYVDDVKTVIGNSSEVTVHVDDEYPVRFDCNIDDTGDAKIIYIIAPRIAQE